MEVNMKAPTLAAVCAVLSLALALACHNGNSAPTQPVIVTPVTPAPTTRPGLPTPTPPKPTPVPPTPTAPAGGATRIVNAAPGNVFMDTVSGSNQTSIKAGDTVQWNFTDSIPHSSTSGACCTADGLWDSGIKSSGSFSHQFPTVGTFPYFCTVHGAMMTGTVTVN
jgi:plastocyanin